jgi:hypothetical protein
MVNTAPQTEIMLTPEELSARWKGKPKPKTLANWRIEGRGPRATRLGRTVRYRLADVEAYEREAGLSIAAAV